MNCDPCRPRDPDESRGLTRIVFAGVVALSALLSACGTSNVVAPLGRAAIRDNVAASARGLHRVISGDSLYSIAWRYGLDHRDLSRWNAIAEPYTIRPDQLLRVSRPAVLPPMPASAPIDTRSSASASAAPRSNTARAVAAPPATKPVANEQASAPPASAAVVASTQGQPIRNWRWPVKGRIIGSFGKAGGKGIDIAGRRGTEVKAAAPGHVVYSGSGLRGYGMLIIVKHNKRYLSAYAHNDRLHVKEGDIVKGGQRIAEMGDSGAKSVRLHFEIRRDGKPVNPTRFLPG